MSRSGVAPMYLVRIDFGPAGYLTVNDYATGETANASFTLSVSDGGSTVSATLTEDTNFQAGASNAACAANIAAAINAHVTFSGLVFAAVAGTTVMVIPDEGVTDLTSISFTSSDDIAWSATPYPLPEYAYFASGEKMWNTTPACVAAIAPVASSIDLETRTRSIGDIEITFVDDGVLSDYITRARPKGRKVTVLLGTADLLLSEFVQMGVYVIDDVRPEAGAIVVQCVEPFAQVAENEITAQFVNIHPLEAIRQVLTIAGVPSGFIDDASLESTDAGYDTISHWSVSRHSQYPSSTQIQYNGPNNGIDSPTTARSLISELELLLDGSLRFDEDGTYVFERYDPDGASVRHLTEDDIADFEVVTTLDNLKNTVSVVGVTLPANENNQDENNGTLLYMGQDDISVRLSGVTGFNREYSSKLESQWLGVPSVLYGGDGGFGRFEVGESEMIILGGPCCGFAGTRTSSSAVYRTVPSQRAADTLSSTKLATLLITDGVNREIVEAEDFEYIDSQLDDVTPIEAPGEVVHFNGNHIPNIDIATAPFSGLPNDGFYLGILGRYIIRSGGRGLRGTTERDWGTVLGPATPGSGGPVTTLVFDITIPIAMVEYQRLARFGSGCPVVKFRLPLKHFDLQLGDKVTFTHRNYKNFSKNGANSAVVWEIVSKETTPLEDSPGVLLTLAWVRDDVTWEPSITYPEYTPVVEQQDLDTSYVLTSDNSFVLTNDGSFVLRG